MNSGIDDGSHASALAVAVIDGPYDATALSRVLANVPSSLADGSCDVSPNSACDHGTFIMGLLGARQDALIPGLCADCRIIHIPLFIDAASPSASVDALTAGDHARCHRRGAAYQSQPLDPRRRPAAVILRLAAALDLAETSGALLLVAAGNQGRLAIGQLLSHPVTSRSSGRMRRNGCCRTPISGQRYRAAALRRSDECPAMCRVAARP